MIPAEVALTACLLFGVCPVDDDVPEYYITQQQEEHKGSGVRLTRPDGSAVYINPYAIASVAASPNGGAIISFSGGSRQEVTESVAEVIKALELDRPEGL